MPLDPKVRWLLDQLAALNLPPNDKVTPAEARQNMLVRSRLLLGEQIPLARVAEITLPGPAGPLAARHYTPPGEPPFPVVVYFHGGGWVIGNLDTHDHVCRALAKESGCVVVSVDYRLAPEHRFPAAAEDAYAATSWVAANGATLGVDPARLAVAGDSAGGNLAAVVSLMARDRGGPRLAMQVLWYPVIDCQFEAPSYRENAEGYLLSRADMMWFWEQYLPEAAGRRHTYASPIHAADLRGLPPALVVTAEYDPLRDEGRAYAARLAQADVPTTFSDYPGLVHGFISRFYVLEQGRQALAEAGAALKAALSSGRG
mgnify:CR=1 FL=1